MDKKGFWIGRLSASSGNNFMRPRMPPPPFDDRGGGGGRLQWEYVVTKDGSNTSDIYNAYQKKKLIEDVWAWLHERKNSEIIIEKKPR